MRTLRHDTFLVLASLALSACGSKDTPHVHDGAVTQDQGGGGDRPNDLGSESASLGLGPERPDVANADTVDDGAAVDGAVTELGLEIDAAHACGVAGDACTGQMGCSWGDDVDIGCRSFLVCRNGILTRQGSTFFRCGVPRGNACPAALPTHGAACTLPTQTCSYPTGTCTCATGCESGIDAAWCQRPLTWHCDPPPPSGCPIQAPQLGVPCTDEGRYCGYGNSCADYQVHCQDGRWEPGFNAFGGCA